MPKTLISVSSCEFYEVNGLNNPMRETWLPDAIRLGADVKFFHGSGSTPKCDVVMLPVEDALHGLTVKAKAKARWAVDNGYDFVFSCFPDTYACAERLLKSGFEKYDYFGNVYQFSGSASFCQGGPGYFLSRKACEILANEPSAYLNDDTFIGDILFSRGVHPFDCRRFTSFGPGPLRSNDSITNHLSTQPGGFTGQNMRDEHSRWLAS